MGTVPVHASPARATPAARAARESPGKGTLAGKARGTGKPTEGGGGVVRVNLQVGHSLLFL